MSKHSAWREYLKPYLTEVANNKPAPPPPRTDPTAYGYIRYSSRDQRIMTEVTVEIQRQYITQRYEQLVKGDLAGIPWGREHWPDQEAVRESAKKNKHPLKLAPPGFFEDLSVSAWQKDFARRHGGSALLRVLQPGDHLLIFDVDRVFRRRYDSEHTLRLWRHRHITAHFVISPLPNVGTDADSNFLMALLVAIAERDAHKTSERAHRRIAYAREHGLSFSTKPAWGYKRIEKGGQKFDVPDPAALRQMEKIERLRDECAMTWPEVAARMEADECRRLGRAFRSVASSQAWIWPADRCQRAYAGLKKIREEIQRREDGSPTPPADGDG